jgi:hypothetical protein
MRRIYSFPRLFFLAFRSPWPFKVIEMEIDLHGYHPSEIVQTDVHKIIILQTRPDMSGAMSPR